MSVPVTEDLLPAFLQQSGKVIYSDGNQHGSLYWLNFCHFCKQLRDQNSMYYEVEMKRCTNCTETFTNAEGNEKETGFVSYLFASPPKIPFIMVGLLL